MACLSIYNLICSLEIGSARRQARPSLSSSHTVWTDSVNIVCVMYKAEAELIGPGESFDSKPSKNGLKSTQKLQIRGTKVL